jgi:adenylate cyclase
MSPELKGRLAAFFAADIEGDSRLMGTDEVAAGKSSMGVVYGGRIANTAGDNVLAEFGSSVDAVRCAMQDQVTQLHTS